MCEPHIHSAGSSHTSAKPCPLYYSTGNKAMSPYLTQVRNHAALNNLQEKTTQVQSHVPLPCRKQRYKCETMSPLILYRKQGHVPLPYRKQQYKCKVVSPLILDRKQRYKFKAKLPYYTGSSNTSAYPCPLTYQEA